MAKRGSTPSQIGVTLRDQYGIPQVKGVTGSKILRILKVNGIAPSIPEDLYHLIKKAVNVRKHIEKFRADKDGKFRLILIESRIHRLARYYRELIPFLPPGDINQRKLTPSLHELVMFVIFQWKPLPSPALSRSSIH